MMKASLPILGIFTGLVLLGLVAGCSTDSTNPNTNPQPGNDNTVSVNYGKDSNYIAGPAAASRLDFRTPQEGISAEWRGDSLRLVSRSGKWVLFFSIPVSKTLVGNYRVSFRTSAFGNGNSTRFYFGEETRVLSEIQTNSSTATINITSVDTNNRTFTGDFTGLVNWDGKSYGLARGLLSKVKYNRFKEVVANVPIGTIAHRVNNDTLWRPRTIAALIRQDTLVLVAEMPRTPFEKTEVFQLRYPLRGPNYLGFYSFDSTRLQPRQFFYFGTQENLTQIEPNTILNGFLNVTEYNTSPKYISFNYTFNYTSYGIRTTVTEGQAYRIRLQ